ncbi:MAG: hypothetical protein ACI4QD_02825 [Kiritimatiellia bacterium]
MSTAKSLWIGTLRTRARQAVRAAAELPAAILVAAGLAAGCTLFNWNNALSCDTLLVLLASGISVMGRSGACQIYHRTNAWSQTKGWFLQSLSPRNPFDLGCPLQSRRLDHLREAFRAAWRFPYLATRERADNSSTQPGTALFAFKLHWLSDDGLLPIRPRRVNPVRHHFFPRPHAPFLNQQSPHSRPYHHSDQPLRQPAPRFTRHPTSRQSPPRAAWPGLQRIGTHQCLRDLPTPEEHCLVRARPAPAFDRYPLIPTT